MLPKALTHVRACSLDHSLTHEGMVPAGALDFAAEHYTDISAVADPLYAAAASW